MKAIILGAALASHAVCLSAVASQVDGAKLVRTGDSVAFLGDSITYYGNSRPLGYIHLVMRGLEAVGVRATAIPAGIGGNKSDQMLARLEQDVLSRRPQWMTLSCGVNDVFHAHLPGRKGVPLEDYKRNVTEILDRCAAAGVRVIVMTPTMITEDESDVQNIELEAYCAWLRRTAASRKLPLADLNAAMRAEVRRRRTVENNAGNKLTWDGIHMIGAGDALLATEVLKAMGVDVAKDGRVKEAWAKLREIVRADESRFALSAKSLLLNGALEADQVDVPTYWRSSDAEGAIQIVTCRPSGGPKGVPSVRFYNPPGKKVQNATLRQYDLTLAPGGRYRLSAWIRTKDLVARRFGILAVNARWKRSAGIGKCERDSDWHKVEADIDMFDSADGLYSVAVFLQKFAGELEVADLKLVPLDETTRKNSKPSSAGSAAFKPRLLPWKPLLSEIDPADRTVTFRFAGELPKETATSSTSPYRCVLTCGGESVSRPLSEFVRFALPRTAPSSGVFRVALVKADETEILANGYSYRLRPRETVDCSSHRVLNNFVTEVLSAKTEAPRQTFRFATVRDGWVFVSVGTKGASVTLDGRPVVDAAWSRAETFRNILRGGHELIVSAPPGTPVVVRSIVETLNYPPCTDSGVKENPSYGWEFFRRYVMPNATTQNGGMIPPEHQVEFRAHGGEWLSNFVQMKTLRRCEDFLGILGTSDRWTNSCYDGTTIDEFFLGSADSLERYAGGLRLFGETDPGEKRIYTWVIGKPGTDGLSREFFATCLNASRGRGKVLIEVYARSKPSETAARAYLKTYFADTLDKCRACYPGAEAATGLILGNFNQMPLISAVHHPEVDMKYYLDLQLNYLANDPSFRGLGCTGYWGSYYGDHEMHRWSMALLRHYCVEGRREMLSSRYGYSYIPEHLTNGDFRGTFDGWKVSGKARLEEAEGLSGRSEARWGGTGGVGDTFATLVREPGKTNRLEQTIIGLTPGRAYCLQAAIFDAKDVRAGRLAPRKISLSVTVSSAEVLPSLSWVHEDRRTKLSTKHLGARINLHHIVFRATGPEARVAIDDAAATVGEELGVNAVSVNPYYEEE